MMLEERTHEVAYLEEVMMPDHPLVVLAELAGFKRENIYRQPTNKQIYDGAGILRSRLCGFFGRPVEFDGRDELVDGLKMSGIARDSEHANRIIDSLVKERITLEQMSKEGQEIPRHITCHHPTKKKALVVDLSQDGERYKLSIYNYKTA